MTELKTTGLAQADVQRMEELYYIKDRAEVLAYIEKYSFLMPLLLEAPEKIKNFFPASELFLKVVIDREEPDWVELAIYINVSCVGKEAHEKLTRLDEEWWLDASDQAKSKLFINLEFV